MEPGVDLFAFNAELENFALNVVPQAHKKLQVEIAAKLFELISVSNFAMEHHPRKTGFAQGNWRLSVVQQKSDVLGGKDNPPPVRSTEQVKYQLRGIKPFQQIWIFNNVPYMVELENGSSKYAPSGIVGPAMIEIELYIETLEGDK